MVHSGIDTEIFTTMESIQLKFLRSILGLPSCVPNVLLQLETGDMLIESWAWILKLYFWLKVFFTPVGLTPLGVVEMVGHVLLYCSFYTGFRDTFIHPILQSILERDNEYYTHPVSISNN